MVTSAECQVHPQRPRSTAERKGTATSANLMEERGRSKEFFIILFTCIVCVFNVDC
jgi:hypothetical protein